MRKQNANSWNLTTCNRIIAKTEETRQHECHLRHLATTKSGIDNRSPRRFPHLQNKLKTRELQKDRANEIQLENRILLQKMLSIDTREGDLSVDKMSRKQRTGKSLNSGFQKTELDRITRANKELLKRLESTASSVPRGKWIEDEHKRVKLVQKIGENSNRYRRDLNLRVPPSNLSQSQQNQQLDQSSQYMNMMSQSQYSQNASFQGSGSVPPGYGGSNSKSLNIRSKTGSDFGGGGNSNKFNFSNQQNWDVMNDDELSRKIEEFKASYQKHMQNHSLGPPPPMSN